MASSFTVIDYVLFGTSLFLSTLIGLYFAYKDRNAQNNSEFLMGGRKMPVIPTALSLLSSFVSGIAFLGYPAEIYAYGTAFVWSGLGAAVAIIISAVVLLPTLHGVTSVNVYQYLEDRYHSASLRLYGTGLFIISNLMYLAVVLYAPSAALASVTELPTWIFILSVGIVCTFYTSIGGLKAVVWTDSFQAIIMYTGSIMLLVRGTIAVGGVNEVLRVAKDRGLIAGLWNSDPDPFQYMTVWTAFIGGIFYWLYVFGANQMALQRYCSVPTLRKAQIALFFNVPALALVQAIAFATGIVMAAYYASCDPIKDQSLDPKVTTRDQMVIHFMLDVLGDYKGLPGLFLACLFSGTLSSVSSGINSLSAVTVESIRFRTNLTDRKSMIAAKLLTIVYGIISMGLAFLAQNLGGIVEAVQSGVGCLSGPLIGLFLIGVATTWTNKYGAAIGAVFGSLATVWVFVGQQITKPYQSYVLPTTNVCCPLNFSSQCTYLYKVNFSDIGPSEPYQGLDKLYALSYNMYTLLGCIVFVIFTCLVSLVWKDKDVSQRERNIDMAISFLTKS